MRLQISDVSSVKIDSSRCVLYLRDKGVMLFIEGSIWESV